MKKVLLLAMAAAAVVACQKNNSESIPTTGGNAEMSVVTSIKSPAGRAVVDGISLPNGSKLGVIVRKGGADDTYPQTHLTPDYADGSNILFKYNATINAWVCRDAADAKNAKFALYENPSTDVDFDGDAFAYYPYAAAIDGVGAAAAIPVTTLASGTVNIPTGTTKGMLADAKEVDYMYSSANETGLNSTKLAANFTLSHSMARVSFVITKDGVKITEPIYFEGFSIASQAVKGASATSKMTLIGLQAGDLSDLAPTSYVRAITGEYLLADHKDAFTGLADFANYVGVGCVVAPSDAFDDIAGPSSVTVDVKLGINKGKTDTYFVTLPTTSVTQWEAGKHYMYHIVLTEMNSLKVRQVTVTDWVNTFGGSVEIK